MSVPVNRERLKNEVHIKTRKSRELTHVRGSQPFLGILRLVHHNGRIVKMLKNIQGPRGKTN